MRFSFLTRPVGIGIMGLLFLITLGFTGDLLIQENSSQPKISADLTLQHVTRVVSDFSESEKFYKEILGLKEIEAPWLPENQMFLSVGENLELHVGEVSGVEIRHTNVNHIALSTSDFDGFLEYLKDKGIVYSLLGGGPEYEIQKRPDGVRQAYFQDPDGYWLEINDATD